MKLLPKFIKKKDVPSLIGATGLTGRIGATGATGTTGLTGGIGGIDLILLSISNNHTFPDHHIFSGRKQDHFNIEWIRFLNIQLYPRFK